MKRFEGRVAVVTGAGSGIGQATAARFGEEGAVVACVDIAEDRAGETVATIVDGGGKALAVAANVADKDSVTAAMTRVVSELGPPNVVCNIAGIGWFAHSHEQPIDDWNRIIGVNLTGTFLMSQAALPHLMETHGNIVNTASNAGLMGQKYSAAYCASKGGVVMLTKALSNEYIDKGVRVNCVAPGGVETPIMNSFMELPAGADTKFFRKIMSPLGMAKPSELASLFAYIASDEARFMTGSIVSMDGGLTS
jgi:NAD(P)-dependent dehydrogenase (short-subunit alcohol dehydrogenase family)